MSRLLLFKFCLLMWTNYDLFVLSAIDQAGRKGTPGRMLLMVNKMGIAIVNPNHVRRAQYYKQFHSVKVHSSLHSITKLQVIPLFHIDHKTP